MTKKATRKEEKFKPGQYNDITNTFYHTSEELQDHLSRSDLISLAKSPAHYKAIKEKESDKAASNEMLFGSAAHSFILQDDTSNIAIGPDVNKLTKAWREFANENKGLDVITPDDMEILKKMKDVFFKHKYARAFMAGNDVEIETTFLWNHKMFEGIKCKCRPDLLRKKERIVGDYKTSKSAWIFDFQKSAVNYGYDIQAKYYLDGVETITGLKNLDFYFIVQEKEPPFAVQIFFAGKDLLELGQSKINQALTNYWWAHEHKNWTQAYPEEVLPLHPPAYALREYNL